MKNSLFKKHVSTGLNAFRIFGIGGTSNESISKCQYKSGRNYILADLKTSSYLGTIRACLPAFARGHADPKRNKLISFHWHM